MEKFQQRLQWLSRLKNFEQADLARALGKDPSMINKWWSGDRTPGPKNLRLISDYFECNTEWLATGKGEPFSQAQAKSMNITGNQNIQSGKNTEARNVHQNILGGETMNLSNEEAFLINTLRKLQKKEEVLRDLIFQVMQHEREQKKTPE